MHKLRYFLRNTTLYVMTAVLLGGVPMSAFAANEGDAKKKDSPKTYEYDSATGRWSSNVWAYDSATKTYVPTPKSSTPVTKTDDTEKSDSQEPKEQTASNVSDGIASVDKTVDGKTEASIKNDADVMNDVESDAQSGDAGVTSNTNGGNAKTGDASAQATIINSVHSTMGGETKGVAHFTADIDGDIVGDITLGPAIKNATVNNDTRLSSKTDINNATSLNNDVSLNATSGDATVDKNTKAGSATSGDANTVANVLNLINTIIAANKSFVGTINIKGNLNGDILISPEFIPQLIASNADIVSTVKVPISMNANDDQSIVNNVKLNATTGDAVVSDNTGAGEAKTGTAETNLTILNLTGHEVSAANSLLVFVNVLGKWVGMIVDAPGATAAALGNGVINNTTNLSSQANLNNNASITNNIDLSSVSGDASVTKNTSAGDATTGDATASANIANLSTSVFNLTDWFGVLFINVFGEWVGSFGVDTKAGTITPINQTAVPSRSSLTGAPNLQFGFTPKKTAAVYDAGSLNTNSVADDIEGVVAVAADGGSPTPAALASSSQEQNPISTAIVVASLALLGAYIVYLGIRRWVDSRPTGIAVAWE